MNHEEAFAKSFIASEKRARFIQFLADPRRRKEMLDRLSRNLPYISALASEVPSRQDFPEELERLLRARGPTCYVLSDGLKLDRKEVPLREALDQVCMHAGGAILCCLPGTLAYYKPESPGPGIVLEKPRPSVL